MDEPQDKNEVVVYSFGLGNDPSFDLEIIQAFADVEKKIVVHAFDPTPTGVDRYHKEKNPPSNWKLHEWGLYYKDEMMEFLTPKGHGQYSNKDWDGKYDGTKKIKRQGYRLATIMDLLEDDHVEVCKIDIEGSEWGLIPDIIKSGLNIDQLYFEFHFFDMDKSDGYSKQVTEVIEQLNELGYKWYHRNAYRSLGAKWDPPQENWYVEYCFIRD